MSEPQQASPDNLPGSDTGAQGDDQPHGLTLVFLQAHPVPAARVLESLPVADAVALFERTPARVVAPVAEVMLFAAAARIVTELPYGKAAALLSALGPAGAAAVLRHVTAERRTPLLEALPAAQAFAVRLLLGYAEDSVAAWVDPNVIALPRQTTIVEALERVQAARSSTTHVFVVEDDQRLAGVIAVDALLRAGATARVGDVARPHAVTLPAALPLATAASDAGWQTSVALPVVDRAARLVGLLHRATLTRALAARDSSAAPAQEASLAGVIARGYWEALSGLAEAASTLLPPTPPVDGRKR
jgi:Mg/Co/Ni transporter MgtE